MMQHPLLRRLVLIGLILLLAALYVTGAVQQLERVNTKRTAFDQSAYMDFTRQVRESGFTYTGDRNRMPLYPALQALFYRPGASDEELFRQGKYVNLILSLILLAGLALIFRRFFGPLHTLNLTLITGFTMFIFRAGWFQAELLFYFLNFCLFLLLWRLLERPSLLMALLAGLAAALAYLTKASILPGLAVFAVCAAAQAAWLLLRRPAAAPAAVEGMDDPALATDDQPPAICDQPSTIGHPLSATGHQPAPNPQSIIKNPQSPWLCATVIPIVFAVFLLALFPYLNESKRVFGQYSYTVNSTFYVWYDTWEQTKLGTRAHGDREGWPDMPADQIPSLAKYLREHSPRQIGERFLHGAQEVTRNVARSYGYAKYALIYAAALIAAAAWQRRRAATLVRRHAFLVAFLALYFAGYFLLYAWYSSIAAGNRLVLGQLIPLLFTLSMGLQALLRGVKVRAGRPLDALTGINLLVLAVLVVDIVAVLAFRVGRMEGGS
jgi:hypothetical protein